MTRRYQLVAVALLLAAAGCPKRAQTPTMTSAEQGLERAMAELNADHYAKAEELFTFIIFNYPGSRQAADAQYYLAESYFRDRDYVQSQTELDFYLKNFPNGRFQEDATYKLALSYLRSAPGPTKDQTRALKAEELIDEFLDRHPESALRPQAESVKAEVEQRLAFKEFQAARLYSKSGEYKSALVYYQYVLASHPSARWTGRDRYQFGVAYLETGSPDKARDVFEEIAAGDYEPAVRQLARGRLARMH